MPGLTAASASVTSTVTVKFTAPEDDDIVLEVTERSPIESVPDVRERVRRLRELGFRLAIDDLGSGYAGLTSFASLQPDFVKLDRGLVAGLDHAVDDRAIGLLHRPRLPLLGEVFLRLRRLGQDHQPRRFAIQPMDQPQRPGQVRHDIIKEEEVPDAYKKKGQKFIEKSR